jgi:hypothetical protein
MVAFSPLPKAHRRSRGGVPWINKHLRTFFPLLRWALLCALGLTEEPSLDIAQALESSGDFFLVFLRLYLFGLQLPFQHMRNEFFN